MRYFQNSSNQGPSSQLLIPFMSICRCFIDLCYPTACGLLVQSPPGATHGDFVDVATLISVPVSLLQSEMSA